MIDEGSWDMPFSLLLDSVYTMQFLTFQTGWAFQYLMKILQMSYSVFTKHSLEPLFAQASNECYSTVHSVDKVVSRRNTVFFTPNPRFHIESSELLSLLSVNSAHPYRANELRFML